MTHNPIIMNGIVMFGNALVDRIVTGDDAKDILAEFKLQPDESRAMPDSTMYV